MNAWAHVSLLMAFLYATPGAVAAAGDSQKATDCSRAPSGVVANSNERYLWQALCRARPAQVVNLDERFRTLDASADERTIPPLCSPLRGVRAEFVHRLTLAPESAGLDLPQGLRLAGLTVTGSLDLSSASIAIEIWLDRSCFLERVHLISAKAEKAISFSGTTLRHGLDAALFRSAAGLFLDATLVLPDRATGNRETSATLNLASARVAGDLVLDGARVKGDLSLNSAAVDGILRASNAETGRADLTSIRVGRNLQLHGTQVFGELRLDQARIGGSLRLDALKDTRSRSILEGLTLANARVDGNVDLSHLVVACDGTAADEPCLFDLGQLRVGNSLIARMTILCAGWVQGVPGTHFRESGRRCGIRSWNTRVEGSIDLAGAYVGGWMDLDGAEIGKDLRTGGDCNGHPRSHFAHPLSVRLARIGGDVHLGAALLADVDMTSTEVGGSLRLGRMDDPGACTRWRKRSRLQLRNARAGAFEVPRGHWPDELSLDLRGFTYQRLAASDGGRSSRSDARWTLEELQAWLRRQDPAVPHAHRELARVLADGGDEERAREVLFDGREVERQQALESDTRSAIWLWIQYAVIGYGHYPWRALWWVGAFVLAGLLPFWAGRVRAPAGVTVHPLACSIDLLLPIVALRKVHEDVEFLGWASLYYAVHRVAGYVLAIFIGAALSGLTGG